MLHNLPLYTDRQTINFRDLKPNDFVRVYFQATRERVTTITCREDELHIREKMSNVPICFVATSNRHYDVNDTEEYLVLVTDW